MLPTDDRDRLLAEARTAREAAERDRGRARRLAVRFARRLRHRHAEARRELADREAKLAADRERFAADVAHLNAVRSEFHAAAAAARDRLRDAWATVEAQQKRAAGEWAEANQYFTAQTTALDARAATLARHEKAAADRRAAAEAETAGLREEAAALEARARNVRAALAELERRRDRARAELLAVQLPPELAAAAAGASDLSQRELQLNREKATVAALKSCLLQEAADVDDRRRLLAEQFTQLAEARVRWQGAERQTVVEMEDIARDLHRREAELDAREQRLIRADARRREEAYDSWQVRLRLESWQSKLTAFEVRWHTEREQLETDFDRRTAAVARREALLGAAFARWEQARTADHARLRAELEHWAAGRDRLGQAAADFDRHRRQLVAEVAAYAARAMAAGQLPAEARADADRRLAVLRKRWDRAFDRRVKEIEVRRSEVASEFAAVDARYRELHLRLATVVEREAALNDREAAADRRAIAAAAGLPPAPPAAAPSAELAALRGEVERLAAAVLEIEFPEPPDVPEHELPWAAEEPDPGADDVVPFGDARAA